MSQSILKQFNLQVLFSSGAATALNISLKYHIVSNVISKFHFFANGLNSDILAQTSQNYYHY